MLRINGTVPSVIHVNGTAVHRVVESGVPIWYRCSSPSQGEVNSSPILQQPILFYQKGSASEDRKIYLCDRNNGDGLLYGDTTLSTGCVWVLTDAGNGFYYIENVSTGNFLQALTANNNKTTYATVGPNKVRVALELQSGTSYKMRYADAPGTNYFYNTQNGKNVALVGWSGNGAWSQYQIYSPIFA